MKQHHDLRFACARRLARILGASVLAAVLAAAQQPYTLASPSAPGGPQRAVGASFAAAGDVNLDGTPDVIAGFPYNRTEANDPLSDGISYPATASSAGFRIWTPSTGAIIRTVVEPGFSSRGFALANLGDINGDGIPDQAVSDPAFPQVSGVNYAGRVDAYSGADGSVLWSFISNVPGARAGVSLARIADVNGDGTGDLLVGAVGLSGVAGRVFVISARTGALLRTHVGTNGDALGYATANLGDLDGDGISDYAAGAPQTGVIGSTQPAGFVRIWSGATGAVIRTVNGAVNFDRFGRALAPAGDLNGDGVPDLFVGAPSRFGQATPGRLYALSGANGAVLLNVTRNVTGDRFGWALSAVGDRNGDGKTDCAVGTAVGVVEIRSGVLGGLIATQTGILSQTTLLNSIVMQPTAVGDLNNDGILDVAVGSPNAAENGLAVVFSSLFGSTLGALAGDDGNISVGGVAALGDLDGDGVRDLAIPNTRQNAPGMVDVGGVLLWSPRAGTPIAQMVGGTSQAGMGFSVTTLSDVDHDGVEDFLVGSPGPSTGSATCYSGATRLPLYTTNGVVAGGAFGYTLARLSDLDGDGVREFAVGAPYASVGGAATTGQVYICSGATGAILRTASGTASIDFFGNFIAEVGDVNGDGVPDLIVGAPYASPGGLAYAGLARIISGATGLPIRTHNGAASGIAHGGGVCGLGDVNGDGVPDYAIASPANTASAAASAGPVVIYSGSTGAVIRTIGPSPIPAGFVVNDYFGQGLSNAGDLDGDGVSDLLLGAGPWLGFPPTQSREIHAYSGATGALIMRQTADVSFTPIIPAPNTGGFDLSGDGVPDWVTLAYPAGPGQSSVRVMSRAGVSAGSSLVGAGCNLAVGLPPVLQTAGGGLVAAQGAPLFELLVSRAGVLQVGALTCGGSDTMINNFALPFDLGVFGYAGCFLYNSADALSPLVTTAGGMRGIPTPLAAQPGLAGATVHLQVFFVDGTGAIISATNGLKIVVQ